MRVMPVILVLAILGGIALYGYNQGWWSDVQQAAENSFTWHDKAGGVAFQKMEYEKAVEHFTKALQLDPNHENAPLTMRRLGDSYRKLEQYDKAKETYEKVLTDYKDVLNEKVRGWILQDIEKIEVRDN